VCILGFRGNVFSSNEIIESSEESHARQRGRGQAGGEGGGGVELGREAAMSWAGGAGSWAGRRRRSWAGRRRLVGQGGGVQLGREAALSGAALSWAGR